MDKVTKAIEFAAKAHDGMVRKKDKTPYILHPLEAAVIVGTMTNNQDVISAAVLHDVVEDTGITIEEIEEMEKTFEGANINACKERLAYEVTKIVHGEAEADKALEAARAIFAGKGSSENMPTVSFAEADFVDGKLAVTEALIRAEIAKSKGEGKRLIEQGGITVNDEKVSDVFATIERSAFDEGEVILKKGKKIFKKLIIE
mgnify:CR=1 FL=1